MIPYLKHIMAFLGPDQKRVKLGVFLAFIESIFANMPVGMMLYGFTELAGGTLTGNDILLLFAVMLCALFIRIVLG